MDADGSNTSRLSGEGEHVFASAPAWSPDGRMIAFVSNFPGISNISVMDADGSDVIQLTDEDVGQLDEAFDFNPAWSPDGLHNVFITNRDDPRPASYDSGEGDAIIRSM